MITSHMEYDDRFKSPSNLLVGAFLRLRNVLQTSIWVLNNGERTLYRYAVGNNEDSVCTIWGFPEPWVSLLVSICENYYHLSGAVLSNNWIRVAISMAMALWDPKSRLRRAGLECLHTAPRLCNDSNGTHRWSYFLISPKKITYGFYILITRYDFQSSLLTEIWAHKNPLCYVAQVKKFELGKSSMTVYTGQPHSLYGSFATCLSILPEKQEIKEPVRTEIY